MVFYNINATIFKKTNRSSWLKLSQQSHQRPTR